MHQFQNSPHHEACLSCAGSSRVQVRSAEKDGSQAYFLELQIRAVVGVAGS